ncbi:MAG: hypothetical protein ACLP9L_07130 [Thermoguttaceae bacterium]
MTDDRITHRSPFSDWFATQDTSRGVWLCDKASDQKVKVEPLAEWEAHWTWNVSEDGMGIYFRRMLPLLPETKVFSRLDGEPGIILCRLGPDAYEVATCDGIEVWKESDIQPVEE